MARVLILFAALATLTVACYSAPLGSNRCESERVKCEQSCPPGSKIDFKCDDEGSSLAISCACASQGEGTTTGDITTQPLTSETEVSCDELRTQCKDSCPEGIAKFDCEETDASASHACACASDVSPPESQTQVPIETTPESSSPIDTDALLLGSETSAPPSAASSPMGILTCAMLSVGAVMLLTVYSRKGQVFQNRIARDAMEQTFSKMISTVAQSMPRITIGGKQEVLMTKDNIVLGNGPTADVQMSGSVEPDHITLEYKNGCVYVTAKGDPENFFSPTNVWLEGNEIRPNIAYLISPGGTIAVGTPDNTLTVDFEGNMSQGNSMIKMMMEGMMAHADPEVKRKMDGFLDGKNS